MLEVVICTSMLKRAAQQCIHTDQWKIAFQILKKFKLLLFSVILSNAFQNGENTCRLSVHFYTQFSCNLDQTDIQAIFWTYGSPFQRQLPNVLINVFFILQVPSFFYSTSFGVKISSTDSSSWETSQMHLLEIGHTGIWLSTASGSWSFFVSLLERPKSPDAVYVLTPAISTHRQCFGIWAKAWFSTKTIPHQLVVLHCRSTCMTPKCLLSNLIS